MFFANRRVRGGIVAVDSKGEKIASGTCGGESTMPDKAKTMPKDEVNRFGHDFPFIESEGRTIGSQELLQRSRKLANRLQKYLQRFGGDPREFFVCEVDPFAVMQLVFAGAFAGRIPVLGVGLNCQDDGETPPVSIKELESETTVPDPEETPSVLPLDHPFGDGDRPVLAFHTSGSTGKPVKVYKNRQSLLTETAVLRDTFSIGQGERFVSLVSPVHIYGFLHAFLLPFFTGGRVRFADVRQGPWGVTNDEMRNADVLIIVPALWSLVRESLPETKARLLVSSGAPLGHERGEDFLAIRADDRTRLCEVFGSTESGGIGWREVGQNQEGIFRFFPGISIDIVDGIALLESPYLFPQGQRLPLSDNFRLMTGGLFEHLGRIDRVFKFAGNRFSLNLVEQNLACVLPECQVRCYFHPDEHVAKGGSLVAFVEADHLDVLKVRTEYLRRFETPFPHRFCFVRDVRLKGGGKVTYNQLLGCIAETVET
jgi:hypothetical protein